MLVKRVKSEKDEAEDVRRGPVDWHRSARMGDVEGVCAWTYSRLK
jgi:hypothetical protein